MRVLEVLEIPEHNIKQAFEELDQLVRRWADRYHSNGGQPCVLQMVAGPDDR